MPDPYTIRIFVAGGDPNGLCIIDRMNWTGLGIAFPRDEWPKIKSRSDCGKSGVYILIGYVSEDDLATLYIGQGEVLRTWFDNDYVNKGFGPRRAFSYQVPRAVVSIARMRLGWSTL
jgi:hypothetical protein